MIFISNILRGGSLFRQADDVQKASSCAQAVLCLPRGVLVNQLRVECSREQTAAGAELESFEKLDARKHHVMLIDINSVDIISNSVWRAAAAVLCARWYVQM